MDNAAGTIREHLMAEDKEYQRLSEEHARYEAQLEALEEKRYLSDEEQVEEVRLKKLKLRAKDQMQERIHRAMSV